MLTSVHDLILEQCGKDFGVAFKALDSAAAYAERQSRAKDRTIAAEARERRADLGRVMFWFHHAARADGIKAGHWSALKILAQDFVDRGILEPAVMSRF